MNAKQRSNQHGVRFPALVVHMQNQRTRDAEGRCVTIHDYVVGVCVCAGKDLLLL